MRLIGTFATEREAYHFYSFLLKEGIQNIYELGTEEGTGVKQYRIWVYDENDLEAALHWLDKYRSHPDDPDFQASSPLPTQVMPPTPAYAEISEKEDQKWQSIPPARFKIRRFSFVLTRLVIILCGVLFLWNGREEVDLLEKKGPVAVDVAMTPLMQVLLFDDPSSYRYVQQMLDTVPLQDYKEIKQLPPDALALLKQSEEAPSWRGLYAYIKVIQTQGWAAARAIPWFEKIAQGEVWRLFTPCLLHRDFLHILFNMVWVWILLKQLESRLPRWKIVLLVLLLGVVANVAQYLVSGPYFLGFSGVVVGLAGFIWARQKRAPWEGYTVQKSTLLFLLFFVLGMFVIEGITLLLHLLTGIQVVPNIANTAHIVGGVTGLLLGRCSFFGRKAA